MTIGKVEINKVSIIIESLDESNASVRLVTDPVPTETQEIADTPAVLLASNIWNIVENYLDTQRDTNMNVTLQ